MVKNINKKSTTLKKIWSYLLKTLLAVDYILSSNQIEKEVIKGEKNTASPGELIIFGKNILEAIK